MESNNTDLIMQNRVFLWIALVTGLILLVPLMAMQFTSEVNWTVSDFVVMGTLLFGTGFIFVQVARVTPRKYWVLLGTAFVIAILWLWVELAVGLFTDWGS
jgi:hypothetical protein